MKIFSLLIAAAIATPLLAQGATPPLTPDLPHTKTVLDALLKAGPVMVPLFLLSIFSVMLVIVYLMTIRRGAVVSNFTTKNPNADFQQVREIAETEGTRVAANLNNRVVYLADIGMIAPLLGLLGTVFGIIRSFGALGADLGTARYVLLSQGISEALVNTAAGLAIGIPAMMFYAFFRGRAQRLISDLESACTHVLALLSLQYSKQAERTPVLLEDEF